MSKTDEAIQTELFNDARFMMALGREVSGLPYRDAKVTAMDFIQDRLNIEYESTDFGGSVLRTICWWAISEVNYGALADEALERLGVR